MSGFSVMELLQIVFLLGAAVWLLALIEDRGDE